MNQYYLGVDTSSYVGSMALFREMDDRLVLISEASWKKDRSHSEVITQVFKELLEKQNLEIEDIGVLLCGVGPGSFTGIRVGINFVKTLAYSNSLPVYTFDSLNILAGEGLNQNHLILCLVNAFKNMNYCSLYKVEKGRLTTLLEPIALGVSDLESKLKLKYDSEKFFVVGNGLAVYSNQFSPELLSRFKTDSKVSMSPRARTFGQIWTKSDRSSTPKAWQSVIPLYIRASEAEEKLQMGLLKPI